MGKGFLLDTHALIWWLYSPERIPARTLDSLAVTDAPIHASAVSAFEISLKVGRGRLDIASRLGRNFEQEIAIPGFLPLSLRPLHAQRAGLLTIDHRDPFDRMLIAQALVEDLVLVSNEAIFDAAGVARLW